MRAFSSTQVTGKGRNKSPKFQSALNFIVEFLEFTAKYGIGPFIDCQIGCSNVYWYTKEAFVHGKYTAPSFLKHLSQKAIQPYQNTSSKIKNAAT